MESLIGVGSAATFVGLLLVFFRLQYILRADKRELKEELGAAVSRLREDLKEVRSDIKGLGSKVGGLEVSTAKAEVRTEDLRSIFMLPAIRPDPRSKAVRDYWTALLKEVEAAAGSEE